MSNNPTIFRDEDFEEVQITPQPVTCLGMTFESDEARKAYFREELRKKLPELRKIEGFPIGEDDDIINLSDPPYYTACPNPWLNDFIAEWEKEKGILVSDKLRLEEFSVNEPYTADISIGKNNPIYNAHSYHTKVPHPAIMKLLEHYTQPGDIIYDGFAGTGMTGVAAGMMGENNRKLQRHCVCNDLSPIASFISYNLNINDSRKLKSFYDILDQVESEYGYLYKTCHKEGYGEISYVVWSDIIVCDHCSNETPFWNLFVEYGKGNILDEAVCPHCGSSIKRSSCVKLKSNYFDKRLNDVKEKVETIPVLISYKYNGKKYTKKPDKEDFKLIQKIGELDNDSWYPTNEIGSGDKMEDPHAKGIYYTHQFYSDRTLFLLSKIWKKCDSENWFCITNSISRNLTKLNRFIVNKYNLYGRINGPLSGTLYVPSEVVEQNVFELLRQKSSGIEKYRFDNALQVGDALHNKMMPNSSVDYIFTDPPFGANIMYSELNRISESWLKVMTNNEDEAIENKSQGKMGNIYQTLMTQAFVDYYRILKPGKWMTVEFSNTSARIWNAIQYSLTSAGFVIASVTSFDKVHGGIKSMRYTTAVKEDLIITCYKPTDSLSTTINANAASPDNAWSFISELLQHLPVHLIKENVTTAIIERSPKILYDRLIAYYVQHGYAVPFDAIEFQKGLKDRFIERDGMYFTASQALEYEEKRAKSDGFVPMALFIASEADGIEWLKRKLDTPKTYQEIQPDWMKDMVAPKKGDVLPGLDVILEENFIKDEDGKWSKPDPENASHLEQLRGKRLMKEFNLYLEAAKKPKAKRMKDTRLEVLRYGFKDCYKQKNYQDIVTVGDHIQESLLMEDEILLQYYDIAVSRI